MADIENFDDITKYFYLIYDSLLTNKNEQKFATHLIGLSKLFYFTNFKKILHIKTLILNLKDEYSFAYKLCLLLYVKCDLFYKLSDVYDFESNSTETKTLELVVKKLHELHDDILYINAFDLYSYKTGLNDEVDIISTSIDTKSTWEFETRNEIINSLVLLVEHFSINSLQKMGVKLVKYSETIEMSFKELSKYYNKQVLKIEKSLKTRKQYCDSFIEVEKSFVMSLISSDNSLDFDDFEIIIKSTDGENIENYEIENINDFDSISLKLEEIEKMISDHTDKI